MAEARRVIPDIDFNGKSAKKSLDGLTEQIEYDDVASGASDTLSIQVFNKDMKFLKGWLPKKGDRITASLTFKNWTKEGADKKLSCGDFLLDEMKMTGNHNYSGEFIAWEREDDYEFYNDPTVLSFLQEQGVKLLSYRDAEPAKEPYNFSLWRK